MRTPLIVANWKMNFSNEEGLKFITTFQKNFHPSKTVEVVICPPFTLLYYLSVAMSESEGLPLGAQNCHWEKAGAYTGEISPWFLKETCRYVLLGHSERRHIFGETDDQIQKKMRGAVMADLIPILCVGETQNERDQQKTAKVLEGQLTEGLKSISPQTPIVLAYEPVWAIGTGRNATPAQAQEVHAQLRAWLLSHSFSTETRILYGGSVKPDNAGALMAQPDIDGLLVGGASLEVDSFLKIVNY